MNLERSLRKAIKEGEVWIGCRRTEKAVKEGKAKLVIFASNSPRKNFDAPTYSFDGTNVELGSLCGKPFSVSALAIINPGGSDILSIKKK
jgi:large subunit ribosomal protein L30e